MAKFSSAHSATASGSELNSLTNGSIGQSTVVVDNTTNLDPWGALAGNITFNATPTASDTNTLDVYAQPAWDGTNYQALSSATLPQGALYLCSIPVKAATTTQRLASAPFPMPGPILFHLVIQNNTGTTLAASPGTLSLYSWQTQ